MASELNQILPIALGTLAHSSPAAATSQRTTPITGLKELPLNPQALAAAQSLTKISNGPKDQGVQIKKRSEPNFASGDEKEHQEPQYIKKKKKASDNGGTLDVVA
jgi:hypothetical protein